MTAHPQQTISLVNPVADHFETFIAGNAILWQTACVDALRAELPAPEYESFRAAFVAHADRARAGFAFADPDLHALMDPYGLAHAVAREGEAVGQHLVLCGAGPTLNDHAADYVDRADQVWGCNSAVTHMIDQGWRVTHGFTVDQTAHMCAEWASMPDVEYLLASTVHPHLAGMLQAHGRRIRYFHNFVGLKRDHFVRVWDENGVEGTMPYEDWLYSITFPATIRAGSGLNAVTRALDVALFMGFQKITVLGADCCLREKRKPPKRMQFGSAAHVKWLTTGVQMHANGGHALASEATPVTLSGRIAGRMWHTKPDMAITAQWLAKMARASRGRIELIGDTLPNAIIDWPDEEMARLPNFVSPSGEIANMPTFNIPAA